jgi:hypothetical protein
MPDFRQRIGICFEVTPVDGGSAGTSATPIATAPGTEQGACDASHAYAEMLFLLLSSNSYSQQITTGNTVNVLANGIRRPEWFSMESRVR